MHRKSNPNNGSVKRRRRGSFGTTNNGNSGSDANDKRTRNVQGRSTSHPRRPRDLTEKTMCSGASDMGYGYCLSSSDSEIEDADTASRMSTSASRAVHGGCGKKTPGRARMEQRLKLRTFRSLNSGKRRKEEDVLMEDDIREDDDREEDEESTHRGYRRRRGARLEETLPTPSGWTDISKMGNSGVDPVGERRDCCVGGGDDSRPATDNTSKSNHFSLSSATKPPSRNNPYKSKNQQQHRKSHSSNTRHGGPTSTTNKSDGSSGTNRQRSQQMISRKSHRSSHHTVCAISENLARETCVSVLDAGRPTSLRIIKQGNGQTYSETLALLRMIRPDEVLLNEGRKNSVLAGKVLGLFGWKDDGCGGGDGMGYGNGLVVGGRGCGMSRAGKRGGKGRGRGRSGHPGRGGGGSGEKGYGSKKNSNTNEIENDLTTTSANSLYQEGPETATIVKFVPRSYFDQTKGADLLKKLARRDTPYDATLVEEYIILSSSHAVLQYAQLCLGAGLLRNSLALDVNVGGNHRMNIDRSTMTNLELLVNAKTGRTTSSLLGTIDCTKTSVGSRLLRTNLMAPPTRLDTINSRLDLVDAFLEDEEFFYIVMEHLEDLPDVDKMLSYVALNPRKRESSNRNGALFGTTERQAVTARIASKGISALVCIKSTLSVIPSFANVLATQLKDMDESEKRSSVVLEEHSRLNKKQRAKICARDNGDGESDECDSMAQEDSSHDDGDSDSESKSSSSEPHGNDDTDTITNESTLQIGLGTNTNNYNRSASIQTQTRHQLLRAILIAMKHPAHTTVLNAVTDIFTESTTYSKNSHAMRHQECFALKPNTDGMMDVLRKAFLANVDDIYRLADEYSEKYDINVQVKETTSRGYYLSVPADLGLDLPQIFIQPVKNGRFIHCTTEEVYSLNSRAQENVQDLLMMTHSRIQEVLEVARANYDSLASLSDAIALLDMCHCFADNVASSRLPWCRPVLSNRDSTANQAEASFGRAGAMAIRNGRYPIDVNSNGMNSSLNGGDFVPNDTYSSALQNFTVITGINGSGKSTYLKQIALIVILAHCGSYVPADEALIPIRDQICTRIGTADDQEHNISTFLLEMKETAFICNSTTDRSLFLLDELGRATSNEDGVAVAWAVSEFLLTKRAMTFFVTHYPHIAKLADFYPNVQNQHLGSQITPRNGDISYTHKIMPGPCKSAGDYGVEMTATCGWPDDVVKIARNVRQEVQKRMPGADICQQRHASLDSNFAENRRRAHNILCDLAKHLTAMREGEGRLSRESKRAYLQASEIMTSFNIFS
ncbi:hypothetical protein ACHAXS_010571 [Conticribra weissflogii]